MRLLIFSDIHNDWKALERLLAVEADIYFAAGDQVTWQKGLERCGEILARRGDRVHVLPGNHETADEIAQDRVIGGVHFSTDIAAGKVFGDLYHNELLKSEAYKRDIERMKALRLK